MTTTIEESVEVNVPARAAYDQWTQFEEFPRFVSGVEAVDQLDRKRVRWRARIAGKLREWEAEICEQIPDKRIAWRSVAGPRNAGVVTFHRLSDERSKVMVQLDYDPEGFLEAAGGKLGLDTRWIRQALDSFKDFLERRGTPTGAWRGEIESPDERGPDARRT